MPTKNREVGLSLGPHTEIQDDVATQPKDTRSGRDETTFEHVALAIGHGFSEERDHPLVGRESQGLVFDLDSTSQGRFSGCREADHHVHRWLKFRGEHGRSGTCCDIRFSYGSTECRDHEEGQTRTRQEWPAERDLRPSREGSLGLARACLRDRAAVKRCGGESTWACSSLEMVLASVGRSTGRSTHRRRHPQRARAARTRSGVAPGTPPR